jgi:hypothetical protein
MTYVIQVPNYNVELQLWEFFMLEGQFRKLLSLLITLKELCVILQSDTEHEWSLGKLLDLQHTRGIYKDRQNCKRTQNLLKWIQAHPSLLWDQN